MFCISGLIPFTQFDNPYLKKLFQSLGWNSPCAETLSRVIITQLVSKIAFQVNSQLHQNNFLSIFLTMDLWSSSNSKYVGITGNWLDDNWNPKEAIFGMLPCTFDEDFVITADEIRRIYLEIIKLYNIHDKVTCITIDNGSDIISFAEKINKPFIRCGCHCLQLGIEDAFQQEEIFILLAKVKFIAKSIKNSIKLQAIINESWVGYAASKNIKVKKFTEIPIANSTRWNSTYEMLESFLAYYDFLITTFYERWPKNWFLFSEHRLIQLNLVRGFLGFRV